jgi:hypothetical protein
MVPHLADIIWPAGQLIHLFNTSRIVTFLHVYLELWCKVGSTFILKPGGFCCTFLCFEYRAQDLLPLGT